MNIWKDFKKYVLNSITLILILACKLLKHLFHCLDLDEKVEKIPRNERIVVRADLNGHVEEGINGYEEYMGRHGLGKKNCKGQAVVDFAKIRELAITNTYFVNKPAHTVESPTAVADAVCRWITSW